MDFRLSQEVDSWFSHLREKAPFRVKFDLFYMCLMLGLATGRKADATGPEFVGYYVDDYKASYRLISGLLIVSELKRLGINMTEKASVRKVIADLLDSNSPTGLSDEGMRSLNQYSSGGFAYLSSAREKPHHADEFLASYLDLLQSGVRENGFGLSVAERA